MSKRRATDELYGDSAKRADQTGRGAEFTAHLRALNSQFARWAQQQAAQAGDQLWLAGVKDYIKHADKLLEQFDDVLVNGNQHRSSSPLASNLFGTPAPAANGPAAAADAAGGATGRSTGFGGGGGRKSVTFAEQPNFGAAGGSAAAATPGFRTAAGAATPGTSNTANAGHTPAPASGLGFSFGATPCATPAAKGGELPSPEPFILGGSATPSSAGGAAGITPGPSPPTVGFSFGTAPTPAAGGSSGGFGFTPAGAAAAAAAAGAAPAPAAGATPAPAAGATPAPAAGSSGFTFGVSSSSTPAGQDAAAAGTSSSNGAGFSFGTSPAAAAGSTGGFSFGASPASTTAAADGSSGSGPAATTFSFGALPSSSAAAAGAGGAGGSSAPAFGFATTPAAGSGAAGAGPFKFPAPSAAAGTSDNAAAAGGADGDAGDEEIPPKFKPELKVDEATWNVLFSNKARLHVRVRKDSGADWEGRGIGVLTVRQPKQGDSTDKTYVMFSTDVGKQLVASHLLSNSTVMPIPNQPRKCRMSLMVLQYDLPPAGKQGDGAAAANKPVHQLQVCMLTLGTAEKVEEFTQIVEQHKPK